MSALDRQNRLLVAEDWKKVYQSFRNADFQSYDFENLRRTMIDYIRQNYPEDFNDYIESSEYLALIDLIAFLGQSIAFRVDLNARENFLELAERRESILRLARLVGYNVKRNAAATGLLKITSVQTSQTVIDSNGRNVANQVVGWNATSNTNWHDQFIKVMNAAMLGTQQFGNPADKAVIYGIPTEQYRFNSSNIDVPVYSFSKTVSGRSMSFEVTSTTFNGESYIYEETPKLGNKPACIYRDDGMGFGSSRTGFFFNFTQGVMKYGNFNISQPSTTESMDITTQGINNTDIWLYRLDKNGYESEEWTPVPSLEGNNIIYNSLNKNVRNIFSVITKTGDSVSLQFSDGTFGNIPLGDFRVYYRISNGMSYTINPGDIKNISLTIPYISSYGQRETLTLTLGLTYSVSNASTAETNASVKANAPATYYTQNRMITGEDYNIGPLSVNQQVLKVKAVNRSASGISRYFDLVDPTGKYSSTNLFATDGVVYKEVYVNSISFNYATKTDIEGVIYNKIFNIIKKTELRNFYYINYINNVTDNLGSEWATITSDPSSVTGYITDNNNDIQQVGKYTNNNLKYIKSGALVKFNAPTGYYFDTLNSNALVTTTGIGKESSLWAEVVSVSGNGTKVLSNGEGPILLNITLPSTPVRPIISQIIPSWRTVISSDVISGMIDLIFANKPFGLRYDSITQTWKIVYELNLDYKSEFSLGNQGSANNAHKDASWLLLFTTDNEYYTVTSRESRYVFESDKEIRFYFDSNNKVYDTRKNKLVRDLISVLSINNQPNLTLPYTTDMKWDIVSEYVGIDGYIDTKKVIITFADSDNNGVVDDPELFIKIVQPNENIPLKNKYIVQEKYLISYGQEEYRYIDNSSDVVIIKQSEALAYSEKVEGQCFYFVDTNVVKKYTNGELVASLDYKVCVGRGGLKFQYTHTADYESRIDPGVSNLIDVYVLTKDYDIAYRQWVRGAITSKPLPPSTDELYNTLSPKLNLIKAISDEVIYHTVGYKVLFGALADVELQATFKVTKTPGVVISDNDIKTRVITAITNFFSIENWDFGDTFYFSELSTHVMNSVAPNISNFVIVPKQSGLTFGNLFEIKSANNQLFVNGATVDDIEIVAGLTTSNIKSLSGTTVNSSIPQQTILSSSNWSN